MTRVPELRFAGFDGEWEDSIFGTEIVRKSKNSNDKNLVRVEYDDITPDIGILNKDLHTKNSIKKGTLFEKNDVLYGKLRPYLKNYLNPKFKGIAVGDFWVLNFLKGDNTFLFYYIQTNRFQSVANTSIGTKMPRADWNLVSDSIFNSPIKGEQEKIGDLFSKIDQLIESQEKLLDQSIAFKKSMLQKMFPKKDSFVPEFRFDGFNENWEIIPLNLSIKKEFKGKAMLDKLSAGSNEYLDADRLNGRPPFLVDNASDTDKNDILILWDGSRAGSVYTGFEGVLGSTLRAYKIKENFNPYFIYTYLLANQELIMHKYRTPNIPHVVKDFSDIFMIFKTSLKEQEKIGNFFKNLDEKIAKEEKLLDAYKMMKKSLLQKMFV